MENFDTINYGELLNHYGWAVLGAVGSMLVSVIVRGVVGLCKSRPLTGLAADIVRELEETPIEASDKWYKTETPNLSVITCGEDKDVATKAGYKRTSIEHLLTARERSGVYAAARKRCLKGKALQNNRLHAEAVRSLTKKQLLTPNEIGAHYVESLLRGSAPEDIRSAPGSLTGYVDKNGRSVKMGSNPAQWVFA